MFAKPQWFRQNPSAAGLKPVTLAGWGYVGSWLLAIAAPFSLLTFRGQPFEALFWMTAALGALAFDVRQLKSSLVPQPQPANEPASPCVAAHPEIQFLDQPVPGAAAGARRVAMRTRPVAALWQMAHRQASRFRLLPRTRDAA